MSLKWPNPIHVRLRVCELIVIFLFCCLISVSRVSVNASILREAPPAYEDEGATAPFPEFTVTASYPGLVNYTVGITQDGGAGIRTSTTFQVCDKEPAKAILGTCKDPGGKDCSIVTYLKEYHQNSCIRVIQGTDFTAEVEQSEWHIQPSGKHGFISTVIQAYSRHHNLVIRPDDLWLAIMSQFALYIDGNAEKFRNRFVNFEGKKQLVVDMGPGSIDTVSHARFVELMTEEIHKNIVDKEVRDWITPNFTTTTRDDKVAAGIVLMASLKQFFEYIENILCGIPKITLEGTVDDWRNIAARLVKLRSYELESWVDDLLQPIVKQFIRAKAGKVDEEFWNSIVRFGGCGGQINGWIIAFSAFDKDGKWQLGTTTAMRPNNKWPEIDITSLVSGVVYADVLICDNGIRHDAMVFAGHMGQQVMPDEYTLKPRLGWAIALRNSTVVEAELGSEYNKNVCMEI